MDEENRYAAVDRRMTRNSGYRPVERSPEIRASPICDSLITSLQVSQSASTPIQRNGNIHMAFELPALTEEQKEVIDHWQDQSPAGDCFVSPANSDGAVKLLKITDGRELLWIINPDGYFMPKSRKSGGAWEDVL